VLLDTLNREVAAGSLQDRVVRSSETGTLDFYFRVTALQLLAPDDITAPGIVQIVRRSFTAPKLDIDFRLDGLGERGPVRVTYSRSASSSSSSR